MKRSKLIKWWWERAGKPLTLKVWARATAHHWGAVEIGEWFRNKGALL